MMMSLDLESYLETALGEVENKLKKVVNGTLQNAENVARNNGEVKFLLSEVKGHREKAE